MRNGHQNWNILRIRLKLVPLFLLSRMAIAGEDEHGWLEIRHLPRDLTYAFSERNGVCLEGALSEVSALTVKVITNASTSPQVQTVRRADVTRVADGRLFEDVVYSGRSDWSDVHFIPKSPSEHFRVILRSSHAVEGHPVRSSGTDLVIRSLTGEHALPRAEIAKVIDARVKPVSAKDAYMLQESSYAVFVLPVFWRYALRLGVELPVLLYDSSAPPDEQKLACGP